MGNKETKFSQQNERRTCDRCLGKGYHEIRDCSGDVQRTETCSFCEGRGYRARSIEVE